MPIALPRLWFDAAHVAYLKKQRAQQQAHLTALIQWAKVEVQRSGEALYPSTPHPKGLPHVHELDSYIGANSLLCLLSDRSEEKRHYAAQAVACFRFATAGDFPSDLGVGAWSLVGSILLDSCYSVCSPADQAWLIGKLQQLHLRPRTVVSTGNPHQVNNNWWAITHGGCLIAGLAIHGLPGADGQALDCSEGIHWARQRLHAFCHHFGDAGLYHEGLGYQCYTMSMLLTALLADQRHGGVQIAQAFPQLTRSAASLYASVVQAPITADTLADQSPSGQDLEPLGLQLSWNDAGPGFGGGSHEIAMINCAPPEQQGALRSFYDHLHGIAGDRSFGAAYSGMFFAAALYPYAVDPQPAAGILPHFVADNRQGLVFIRSGYEGAQDAVLGAYARATHVGGHAADDAGSLRLVALGHDWMVGGGQNRAPAVYQSVIIDETGERPQPQACGAIIWREENAAGGVVAMDLRKVHGAYSERYAAIDYSAATGVPLALVILDQLDDHRSDRSWLWNWSFAPNLQARIDGDGQGFSLRADDGCVLQARFLGALPDTVTIETMPASRRSYSNGLTTDYLPRGYIQAHFSAQTPLAIYTAITVTTGDRPALQLAGGLDLKIANKQWSRPFGYSIPADFQLGRSFGLCRYPDGKPPS